MPREFEWMETGATPELADLGRRIAACIRKHGYSEREWLTRIIRRQIAQTGTGRACLVLTNSGGDWSTSWRPA